MGNETPMTNPEMDAGTALAAHRTDTVRAAGTLDLTVHRRDPDVEPVLMPATGARASYRAIRIGKSGFEPREFNGHAGKTVCGKTLDLDELWVDYQPEDRDDLCPRCFEDVT